MKSDLVDKTKRAIAAYYTAQSTDAEQSAETSSETSNESGSSHGDDTPSDQPMVETALATTESDAVKTAKKIGYPVVMKIASPQIIHKSDAGGVKVNLTNVNMFKVNLLYVIVQYQIFKKKCYLLLKEEWFTLSWNIAFLKKEYYLCPIEMCSFRQLLNQI